MVGSTNKRHHRKPSKLARNRRARRTGLFEALEARALLSSVPTGKVEVLNSTTVSGWVFNADDGANALNVVITVDGVASTVPADLARPDLLPKLGSSDHGFTFTMPLFTTGTHTVTVDIQDPFNDTTRRIRTQKLTIAPPTGGITTLNSMGISGWAFSAANGGAPSEVILTIDGTQYSVTADDSRANLASKLGSADHGFSFAMPALKPGANSVTVDVLDSSTGLLKRIKTGSIVVGGPVGGVNVFNTTTISGWALSPLEGSAPIDAIITINGQATTVVANTGRPDLAAKYGSAYHGFSFAVPTLQPGQNIVTVDLVDPFTGKKVRIKSGVLMNRPPAGGVDVSTDTRIAGWAADPDINASLQVLVKVDGVAMGAPFTANDSRVVRNGTAVGFDVSGQFAGHVVEVFAYDTPSSQPVRIWTNNHLPRGAINEATSTTLTGWAVDPDALGTPVAIRVDVDGTTYGTTTATLPRADVQKQAGALNVGYSMDISDLTPGIHTVKVYAIDGESVDSAPVLLGTKTVVNAAPVGHIDEADASFISGWALDPDLGTNPTTINIYVDDVLFATTTANQTNEEIPAKYHSTNHGFSVDTSSLSPGSHSVTITADDDRSTVQPEVVIFDGYINNNPPTGAIETVTGKTITGWAYDQDSPSTGIPVDVYLDGVYSSTVTANLADANAPAAHHGFSVNLPAMSFGTHTIDLYADESAGDGAVLIGTRTVTNSRPIGTVESASSTTISGWAADPDRLGESLQVQVYVNGVQTVAGIADDSRPDLMTLAPLNALPGFSDYGFTLSLPTLASGTNQIDVYAVDLNNGQISSLGSVTVVV